MSALELRVPPALVALASAALMWLAAALAPSLWLGSRARLVPALLLMAAGVAVVIAGITAFRRAATTVNPVRPEEASALVTSGVYRMSRNPMYLGFLLTLLGYAVWLAHPLALLVPAGFVAHMNRFQIGPEERVLRAAFGTSFDSYADRTRRWL